MREPAEAARLRSDSAGPLVPATPLYGIPPRGACTGEVESLFSHLLSLSFAHKAAPRQIVSHVLPALEERLGAFPTGPRHQVGWGRTSCPRSWLRFGVSVPLSERPRRSCSWTTGRSAGRRQGANDRKANGCWSDPAAVCVSGAEARAPLHA